MKKHSVITGGHLLPLDLQHFAATKKKRIVVDIGHGSDTFERTGGKAVKVNGKWYEEHEFNSRMSAEVVRLLEFNGFEVLLGQQPGKAEVSLEKRVQLYNKWEPDLIISEHANAGSKAANGICVFYYYKTAEMRKLAAQYAAAVQDAGYKTHGSGIHASIPGEWNGFYMVCKTHALALLFENGFFTNDVAGNNDDFERIFGSKKEQYVRDLARVQVRTICGYFGQTFADPDKAAPVKAVKAATAADPLAKGYLQSGDKGASVGILQSALNRLIEADLLELPKLAVNRIYDAKTLAAVKAFQKKYKLAVDGYYGPKSQAALKAAIAALDKALQEAAEKAAAAAKAKAAAEAKARAEVERKRAEAAAAKAAAEKAAAARPLRRVIINGVQVGAYRDEDNVLQQAQAALDRGAKNIQIEEV